MRKDHLRYEGLKAYTGHDKYLFDFEDGDCWLNVDYYADKPVEVWIVLPEFALPYHEDRTAHLSLRVSNAKAVELRTDKKTKLVARVEHRSVRDSSTMDWTPIELVPPDTIALQMSHLIDQRMQAQLQLLGIMPDEITVNEDDDLDDEGDLENDEFGSGFEEMDEDDEHAKDDASKASTSPPGAKEALPGTGLPLAASAAGGDPVASGEVADNSDTTLKA